VQTLWKKNLSHQKKEMQQLRIWQNLKAKKKTLRHIYTDFYVFFNKNYLYRAIFFCLTSKCGDAGVATSQTLATKTGQA